MWTDRAHHDSEFDEWLCLRCQLGEPDAFDELIAHWNEPLGRYVRRLVGDDDAARDAVQDVWLRVLRGIGKLREPTKLKVWLFAVARRTVMDRLRVKYRTPRPSDVDVQEVAAENVSLALHEDLDALERHLAQLPVVERDVLTLFYLQDLSLTDIAGVLDVPVGTVKSRLFRARRLLRGNHSKGTKTMTIATLPTPASSPMSTSALQAIAAAELAPAARVKHVLLLLGSAGMGVALLSLWLTEPALPVRTHVAFGLMTAIAASWVAYASWALTRRRVLFGRQRVVAARMAVAFTSLLVTGSLAVGATTGGSAPLLAAAMGAAMLVVAMALLVRARRIHAALLARRNEIERALAANG